MYTYNLFLLLVIYLLVTHKNYNTTVTYVTGNHLQPIRFGLHSERPVHFFIALNNAPEELDLDIRLNLLENATSIVLTIQRKQCVQN